MDRLQLHGSHDYIIGSEINYKEFAFQSISDLFKCYLKDAGEISLDERIRNWYGVHESKNRYF